MARLTFPDEGSRLVYRTVGTLLRASAGSTATVYTDSTVTTLADIQLPDGTPVVGSTLTVDHYSRLPLFLGPDGVDSVWVVVGDGPAAPVYARADDRIDVLQATALTADTLPAVGDTRYARVYPVAPTGVAATDTAAVTAAAHASAAAGGGTVQLRPGTYKLSAPLPVLPGVHYEGVEPVLIPSDTTDGIYLGDMDWTYGGGTVIQGDGTFAAFEANGVDQDEVAEEIGATQISSAGIHNVGIENVTYGVRVGATNIMGLLWSTLRNVYVRAASQWGIALTNFQHCTFDNIRTCLSQNGQYYGNRLPKLTLMCGNSVFGELYTFIPRDGRDARLCRGIVFEAAGTSAQLNEITVTRAQANQMSREKLTAAATLTSGSANLTVPDGTKFAVGMPVVPANSVGGFTAAQCYVVASVNGNTITLANDRASTVITANAGGTLNLESYGFPCVEVVRANAGANVRSSRFHMLDMEGASSAALYVDGAELCEFSVAEVPTTGNIHHGVVGRSARWCQFSSPVAAPTDFDANSASCLWIGQRGPIVGRELAGMWLDGITGARMLAIGGGQTNQARGDLHTRMGGYLYPEAGIGERIFPRDTTITFGGFNQGDVVFASASNVTMTLPTIVTDTNPNTSNIGLWFDIYNVGTGTITLNTSSSQTYNKVAGLVSTTITPGASLKVVAAKDNGGGLLWLAKSAALLAS